MTIREKGYHRWDGDLKKKGVVWLPIFRNGISAVFKKRFSKLVLGMAAVPFVIFLIAVYVSTKPELRILSRLVKMLESDALFFYTFYTNGFLAFWLIIIAIFCGAELISHDFKFQAFPLYFSRPLGRWDYIGGKIAIVLFYLLLLTLVPGLLLVIFKTIFTGQFSFSLPLLLAIFFFPVLITLFYASLTLFVSALSPNSQFVKILLFALLVFSDSVGQILTQIFKNSAFQIVSVFTNIRQAGAFFFQTKPVLNLAPWLSLLVFALFSVLFLFLLSLRLKRIER